MPSIACPIFDSSVIPGSPPPDSLKSSTASLPRTQSFRASTFSLTTAKRFKKTLHWSHRNATLASYISSSSCHGGPELDSGFGPHGRGRGCERLRPRAHHRLCCACWSGSRHHQRLFLHLHRLPRRSAACPGHLRHQARLRRRVPGSPRPGRLHRHPRVRPGHHQPPAHSPPRNRGAVRDQGHPYRRPHRQHQQVLLAGAQDRRCLRLPQGPDSLPDQPQQEGGTRHRVLQQLQPWHRTGRPRSLRLRRSRRCSHHSIQSGS